MSAMCFPSGHNPQIAIDDKLMYPIYTRCVELGMPICINGGVVGPRMPSWPQHVERFDNVLYDFPELTMVMMHGGEPWTALAVKLMVKWPGLHYMTSAFAPKHYPTDIVRYANTRGADKVMYCGYFPAGLTLERQMASSPQVAFRDHVWPKFLRENAQRVFGLADPTRAEGSTTSDLIRSETPSTPPRGFHHAHADRHRDHRHDDRLPPRRHGGHLQVHHPADP